MAEGGDRREPAPVGTAGDQVVLCLSRLADLAALKALKALKIDPHSTEGPSPPQGAPGAEEYHFQFRKAARGGASQCGCAFKSSKASKARPLGSRPGGPGAGGACGGGGISTSAVETRLWPRVERWRAISREPLGTICHKRRGSKDGGRGASAGGPSTMGRSSAVDRTLAIGISSATLDFLDAIKAGHGRQHARGLERFFEVRLRPTYVERFFFCSPKWRKF
jgi:hypothetical protein